MKRQLNTGEIVDIHPFKMVEQIDGVWGDWQCEVEKPDGTIFVAYLEGDGHLYHWETLKDEDGHPIPNYPPSDNFTPPVYGNEFKVIGIELHAVVEYDENGQRIQR